MQRAEMTLYGEFNNGGLVADFRKLLDESREFFFTWKLTAERREKAAKARQFWITTMTAILCVILAALLGYLLNEHAREHSWIKGDISPLTFEARR